MAHLQTIDRSAVVANGTQQYSELLVMEKARVQSEISSGLDVLHSGRMAMEDQAPVLHEQFVSIRFNNFAYEKMKAIDAALERLNRGEYGACEECEQQISEKRLKAVPWTRYCLGCQESFGNENGSPLLQHRRAA